MRPAIGAWCAFDCIVCSALYNQGVVRLPWQLRQSESISSQPRAGSHTAPDASGGAIHDLLWALHASSL